MAWVKAIKSPKEGRKESLFFQPRRRRLIFSAKGVSR
jgi:hypothetical protein